MEFKQISHICDIFPTEVKIIVISYPPVSSWGNTKKGKTMVCCKYLWKDTFHNFCTNEEKTNFDNWRTGKIFDSKEKREKICLFCD